MSTNFIQSGLGGNGYAIQTGDRLFFSQKNSSATGGLVLIPFSGAWSYFTSGDTGGSWSPRSIDLSSLAGETINGFWPVITSSPAGSWTQALANVSIVSTNGTVTPIYWGQV